MKMLSALLIFAIALLAHAAPQPVFYHATSGQTDYSRNLGFSIFSGNLIEQPFTPALATIELLDLGFYVFNGGLVDVLIREGDGNGPVIASRLLQIGTLAPYNRTRLFFNPPVAVVPGAPYLLQLVPRPSNPNFAHLFDYFYNHREVPLEQRARRNGFTAGYALDYGFGIVVSDIFPTNRPPVVYYEQQPPVALFGDAVITNDFFTGPAQVDVEISSQSFLGDVYVESNAATIPYVSNSWVTNNGNVFPQAVLRILLNTNTTPAAFQDVLRNVRFQNFSNTVYDSFQFLTLTCSNAFGEFRTTTRLQIFGVDDPSAPRLDFQRSTAFWPATNRVALSPRRRQPALVYLNIYATTDPDGGYEGLDMTHRQDPGWSAHDSTYKYLRPGRHQFTVTAYDQTYTNSITQELEVITVGRALQLWKKGVRTAITDRRDRVALLKPLTAAQESLAHAHKRMVINHLFRFFTVFQERELSVMPEPGWSDNYYAIIDALYPNGFE